MRRTATLLALAVLAACGREGPAPRPNFLLINLDDARADGVGRMPALRQRVMEPGVVFRNAFATSTTCCPSRASLLTGRYAGRHGVRATGGPLGGARAFREGGADRQTIAVWLQRAGYRTGLFGKYLNGYNDATEGLPDGSLYVPPGWDRWWAFVSPAHYGGVLGESYAVAHEDGSRTRFAGHEDDSQYSTDLAARELREFVSSAVESGRPFFAYWAPYAPHLESSARGHAPPAPARRHAGALAGLDPWHPPRWGEPGARDRPRWVMGLRSDPQMRPLTERIRQGAYEALLSVDEQLARTLDHLEALGVARDTVVLLTSDQGAGWGEHGLFLQRKGCPYEECLRVPLVVSDPRSSGDAPAEVDAVALNIDLAATIAELAGLEIRAPTDGRSFAGWLRGRPPAGWRADHLIESWRVQRGDELRYSGPPADGDRLRLFHGDPRADPRPSLVFEFDSGDGVSDGAVAVAVGSDPDESFANLGHAVTARLPGTSMRLHRGRLSIEPVAEPRQGVYWWEELDRGGVIEPRYATPDYVGVRDVANGFTWVEYETGERELYDLDADPHELENRADDPAYAGERRRLERRLRELLAGL